MKPRMIEPILIVAGLLGLVPPVLAQTPPAGTVVRPAGAPAGVVVVPDRFLRRWDPVTIFFPEDVGKPAGTPEDAPQRLVRITPSHPGAFTWLDPRTLELRPADPWPPLQRFRLTVGDRTIDLRTLMPAPLKTVPEADAAGLGPVQAITLVFPDPIPVRALAKMIRIELRPLPGAGDRDARWLDANDFAIKTVERERTAGEAAYVLLLDEPIGGGVRAIVELKLAADSADERAFARIAFATAPPFRVTAVGTRTRRLPVTPEGTRYPPEQAIDGGSERRVLVELSAPPGAVDPVVVRNLIHFEPAVDRLELHGGGSTIIIDGDFQWDTRYKVTITPTALKDENGRPLDMTGSSELYLFFPAQPAYLRGSRGWGIVERFGPQMVPVAGRGQERLDLRVFPVDPLERSFWPFPARPVTVNESLRPPGPGESPAPFNGQYHIREAGLRGYLATLTSPPVSRLVELPLRQRGPAASFGLDLAGDFARISGAKAPGHYLVGLRPVGPGSERQWQRIQVTDLSLTTVEEPAGVRFVVTSLSQAAPVAGAKVTVEARNAQRSGPWSVVFSGATGADGMLVWSGAGHAFRRRYSLMRIVVRNDGDVLALDPDAPPKGYRGGRWESSGTWLASLFNDSLVAARWPERLIHLFTERPIYRPGEAVYIKGFLRTRTMGRLAPFKLWTAFLVIDGPGDLEWRRPVEVSAAGAVDLKFEEKNAVTGRYTVHLEGKLGPGKRDNLYRSSNISFRMEAYRIPRFRVDLHGPERIPMDGRAKVTLTATYYAGGRVAGRPVSWRVTQFPYTFKPAGLEEFHLSSDGRFSRTARFAAGAAVTREDRTNDSGSAELTVDPSVETTAQPRTYVVEATVTGADDQTVTATRKLVAVPAFVLGVKAPRFIEHAEAVEPQVVAIGPDGKLLAGQKITVRLLRRRWHSYLRASDFSDGVPRYVTDVVDEKVAEHKVTSGGQPTAVSFPISSAGVYVVELEARDRVGRNQVVAVDLYAGGEGAVNWPRREKGTLRVVADRDSFRPGETATLVLESPFQRARVLAIVEAPDGNRYRWLDVTDGQATFQVQLEGTWTPRIPVHFVLMRGRVPGTRPLPGSAVDLGKPATLAATRWLRVEPTANRAVVTLDFPGGALPGSKITMKVNLADPAGKPLAGEVTLWLVDEAVLALGREKPLDPLVRFITPVESHTWIRDTRGMVFGEIPFRRNPGGGEGARASEVSLLRQVTVRRNFKTVPFYVPALEVGPGGEATVEIPLPDNLTDFAVRAVAVSGAERFGVVRGRLSVSLPVIVQPALPRFVRPGDTLTVAVIGRVVEGEGGPGKAEVEVRGLEAMGPLTTELEWKLNTPVRVEVPVRVPDPTYGPDGALDRREVVVRAAVERTADGASDGFEVKLPIRPDRKPVVRRSLAELLAGAPVELPAIPGEVRSGTLRRSIVVAEQPALVRMLAGLNALMEYPFGCTEQRLSRARAMLAARRLREIMAMEGGEASLDRAVNDTLRWVGQTMGDGGLVAFWPGTRGYVFLTAVTLDFVVEAGEAGYAVDPKVESTLIRTLRRAMRSDYSRFIDGEAFTERCLALEALSRAGVFMPGYAAELARRGRYLNLEGEAGIVQAFNRGGGADPEVVDMLLGKIWHGVIIRLFQGRKLYGGLQESFNRRNGLVLPSETRSLAAVVRALASARPDDNRLPVLVQGLVTLGRGDGWGSTSADSAALLALAELMENAGETAPRRVGIDVAGRALTLQVGGRTRLARAIVRSPDGASIRLEAGEGPLAVRAEARWVPAAPGSRAPAASHGFVVEREALLVQPDGAPPVRIALDRPGRAIEVRVGDVVEEHVRVVNPGDRHYVAVVVPLAAGMEPLNPALATAPSEARPAGRVTRQPTYVAFGDDRAAFFYDTLPKGAYDFYLRTRATVPGRFNQPPASAELMYDGAVRGNGNGALVVVEPAPPREGSGSR